LQFIAYLYNFHQSLFCAVIPYRQYEEFAEGEQHRAAISSSTVNSHLNVSNTPTHKLGCPLFFFYCKRHATYFVVRYICTYAHTSTRICTSTPDENLDMHAQI
jgi:hypothetical protein